MDQNKNAPSVDATNWLVFILFCLVSPICKNLLAFWKQICLIKPYLYILIELLNRFQQNMVCPPIRIWFSSIPNFRRIFMIGKSDRKKQVSLRPPLYFPPRKWHSCKYMFIPKWDRCFSYSNWNITIFIGKPIHQLFIDWQHIRIAVKEKHFIHC